MKPEVLSVGPSFPTRGRSVTVRNISPFSLGKNTSGGAVGNGCGHICGLWVEGTQRGDRVEGRAPAPPKGFGRRWPAGLWLRVT